MTQHIVNSAAVKDEPTDIIPIKLEKSSIPPQFERSLDSSCYTGLISPLSLAIENPPTKIEDILMSRNDEVTMVTKQLTDAAVLSVSSSSTGAMDSDHPKKTSCYDERLPTRSPTSRGEEQINNDLDQKTKWFRSGIGDVVERGSEEAVIEDQCCSSDEVVSGTVVDVSSEELRQITNEQEDDSLLNQQQQKQQQQKEASSPLRRIEDSNSNLATPTTCGGGGKASDIATKDGSISLTTTTTPSKRKQSSSQQQQHILPSSKYKLMPTTRLRAMKETIFSLWKHEYCWPFHKPVDIQSLNIPDYDCIIVEPIDLGTIKARLNKLYYAGASECYADICTMLMNCFVYNKPTEDVVLMAQAIEDLLFQHLNDMPLQDEHCESLVVNKLTSQVKNQTPAVATRSSPRINEGPLVTYQSGRPQRKVRLSSSSTVSLLSGSTTTRKQSQSSSSLHQRSTTTTSKTTAKPITTSSSAIGRRKTENASSKMSDPTIDIAGPLSPSSPPMTVEEQTSSGRHDKQLVSSNKVMAIAPKQADSRSKTAVPPPSGGDIGGPKRKKSSNNARYISVEKVPVHIQCCALVLNELYAPKYRSFAYPFYCPVDSKTCTVNDYYDVIKHPMDMSTIRTRLETGRYRERGQFIADFRLLIANCFQYNGPDSKVGIMGKELSDTFEKCLKRFKVEEQSLVKSTSTEDLSEPMGISGASSTGDVREACRHCSHKCHCDNNRMSKFSTTKRSEKVFSETLVENLPPEIAKDPSWSFLRDIFSDVAQLNRKINIIVQHLNSDQSKTGNSSRCSLKRSGSPLAAKLHGIDRKRKSKSSLAEQRKMLSTVTSITTTCSSSLNGPPNMCGSTNMFPTLASSTDASMLCLGSCDQRVDPNALASGSNNALSSMGTGGVVLHAAEATDLTCPISCSDQQLMGCIANAEKSVDMIVNAVASLATTSSSLNQLTSSIMTTTATSACCSTSACLHPTTIVMNPQYYNSQNQSQLLASGTSQQTAMSSTVAGSVSSNVHLPLPTNDYQPNNCCASTGSCMNTCSNTVNTLDSMDFPVTYEQKRQLSVSINNLPGARLGEVVRILKTHEETLKDTSPEELEIDFEMLKPATLRALQQFVLASTTTDADSTTTTQPAKRTRRTAAKRAPRKQRAPSLSDQAATSEMAVSQPIIKSTNISQTTTTAAPSIAPSLSSERVNHREHQSLSSNFTATGTKHKTTRLSDSSSDEEFPDCAHVYSKAHDLSDSAKPSFSPFSRTAASGSSLYHDNEDDQKDFKCKKDPSTDQIRPTHFNGHEKGSELASSNAFPKSEFIAMDLDTATDDDCPRHSRGSVKSPSAGLDAEDSRSSNSSWSQTCSSNAVKKDRREREPVG